MGKNLDRIVDTLYLPVERRDHFLQNLHGLAQKVEAEGKSFHIHPENFWEDISGWSQGDRERLIGWLYDQALEAADNITKDYDFTDAPTTVEELETEILEMRIAAGIRRILELRDKYKFAVVKRDVQGRSVLVYPDGRIIRAEEE
jgi:hypothetical protein